MFLLVVFRNSVGFGTKAEEYSQFGVEKQVFLVQITHKS